MEIRKKTAVTADLGLLEVKHKSDCSHAINTEVNLDGNSGYTVVCSIERLQELHKHLGMFLDAIK